MSAPLEEPQDRSQTGDDEPEGAESAPRTAIPESVRTLVQRCIDADIPHEQQVDPTGGFRVKVQLPCARGSRGFVVTTDEDAETLLSFPFESFGYIEGYQAICSYQLDEIVCLIRPAATAGLSGLQMRRLFEEEPFGRNNDYRPIVLVDPRGDLELEAGRLTAAQTVLLGLRGRPAYSLTIRHAGIKRHDQALKTLETYGNSLLFQIDARIGVAIQLARHRELIRRRSRRRGRPEDLIFPSLSYDTDPLSLYWYARGAVGMPLLQFLAYYQVMEFYFPVYSQQDMRRRFRAIVQDPAFSPDSDGQIGRLVSVAASTGGRGAWGDELSQLAATVKACSDPGPIRDLVGDESYGDAFKKRSIASTKLVNTASDDELLLRTAERLYEIRCRIVHTKGDRDSEQSDGLLLPFSKEADMLGPEIDLSELVARQVLAAGGKVIARL